MNVFTPFPVGLILKPFYFRNETLESSLADEDRSLRREEIVIEYWLNEKRVVGAFLISQIDIKVYLSTEIKAFQSSIENRKVSVGFKWRDSTKSLVMVTLRLAFCLDK